MAYRLFSQKKTTGSRKTPVKFIDAWKSPVEVPPSPKGARPPPHSLRPFPAEAAPPRAGGGTPRTSPPPWSRYAGKIQPPSRTACPAPIEHASWPVDGAKKPIRPDRKSTRLNSRHGYI